MMMVMMNHNEQDTADTIVHLLPFNKMVVSIETNIVVARVADRDEPYEKYVGIYNNFFCTERQMWISASFGKN